ncbi:fimbria/pilus outer membrane usher protein [Bosea sp. TWI1241]|uniref:fimbria/pilus outer membrane usher protein n=1 Tax=Bosea sp. TWI1241 TaxID=3148904 RepID=UPI00320A735D
MRPALPARPLQLDVRIGGLALGLIGAFQRDAAGALSATGAELAELGIRTPAGYGPRQPVPLAAIPGLTYAYDEPAQRLDITLPEAQRLPKVYDAAPKTADGAPPAATTTGAVLNYTLFGSSEGTQPRDFWRYPALSATLDGRVFGRFGVLSQTGIAGSRAGDGDRGELLRLDTSWSYSDPASMISYRAGDTISSGLAWTRPIRLGGVQVQRNFGLRPDLITLPLPSFAGSAAVPSTVDVFVNGVRTASQEVGTGPFRIDNLPILSGNGNASIVLRDASGRQTETTLPFVVSGKLLRPGLLDFSAEAGMPRLAYGLRSSLYAETPAGSGSLRYGLSESVTLMAHGEGTRGFGNGGLGAAVGLGSFGLVSAAGSGSWHDGASGAQAYAAFETRWQGISLFLSSQRSFGDYRDLASVTAAPLALAPGSVGAGLGLGALAGDPLGWTRLLLPPRALDRASLGFPVPALGGALNLGYARIRSVGGQSSRVVNASYTRPLPRGGSFYVTAFGDIDQRDNAGVFAGLSFPFGGNITASTGASRSGGAWSIAADIVKPIEREPGSIGWRVRDVEGREQRRSAALAYRGSHGQVEGTLSQQRDGRVAATGQLDGALVMAGGGVFAANRIDDAFAIADVGAPDVDVLLENRVVARTGASGKALVPGLRAYQANRLAIDSRGLPVTAIAETTREVVAPGDRGGVVVDFAVRSVTHAAIVLLHGADGKPLPAGSRGTLQAGLRGAAAQAADFAVGYDGRAFIEHLAAQNEVVVQLGEGECRASFAFAPRAGEQVTVGPVPCR